MSMLSSFLKTYTRGPMLRALHRKEKCPVCSALSSPYDAVDFNKSCEEFNGKFLPPANISILYYLCPACEFCFAPEIGRWSFAEFQERIYNKDYLAIDPDYAGARADFSAETLKNMFGADGPTLKHLDFGGGSGRLSQLLGQAGWNSRSYDPFADANTDVGKLGVFDLITSFEVFEHVPDPRKLFREVSSWLVPDGVVIFSTLLSDGILQPNQRLTWWYAAPRNGHISLYSRQSLSLLAAENELQFGSLAHGLHCMWRTIPAWAAHLFSTGNEASD